MLTFELGYSRSVRLWSDRSPKAICYYCNTS